MLTRTSKEVTRLLSYVRSKYIGTLGCSSSPKLYGKWLNRSKGLSQCCLLIKLLHNLFQEALTRETGDRGGHSPC